MAEQQNQTSTKKIAPAQPTEDKTSEPPKYTPLPQQEDEPIAGALSNN